MLPLLSLSLLLAADITPGPDLKGWTRLPIPPTAPLAEKSQWSSKGGIVFCDGTGGHDWLRYDKQLTNFVLRVEWRFKKIDGSPKYNSGVFVRNSENGAIWHQAQVGPPTNAGFFFMVTPVNGEPKRLTFKDQMKPATIHEPGTEWNKYEIRAEGRWLRLSVNGVETSVYAATEPERGYIGLEGEGFAIEFRKIELEELR
jgi:hypothetical protein